MEDLTEYFYPTRTMYAVYKGLCEDMKETPEPWEAAFEWRQHYGAMMMRRGMRVKD